MTDIDALARRTSQDIAHEWALAGGELSYLNDIIIGHLTHALHEAYATGFSEGFAAGAQAMRERAAAECLRIWREAPNERTKSALTSFRQNALAEGCVSSSNAIRALPLPTIGEKSL